MELSFRSISFDCLAQTVSEPQYQELTGETSLPESMPDIGQIMDCFGLVLIQSKTVENGTLTVTGGVRAGILYRADEDHPLERIDLYLPFLVRKQAQTEQDTVFFYWGWLRNLDARRINPRKILVRGELGSEFTVLTPKTCEIRALEDKPSSLECREITRSISVPKAWAERELSLADEVLLPEQLPDMSRLLKWNLDVTVTDSRVLGSKVVFQGDFVLRTLYADPKEKLHVWTERIPYSQYAELDSDIPDGTASIQPILRSFELDTDGQPQSRRLLINLTATAQIIGRCFVPVTVIEDAYALEGNLEGTWETVDLAGCEELHSTDQRLSIELPGPGNDVIETSAWVDRAAGSQGLAVNGIILYQDQHDVLQSKRFRTNVNPEFGGRITEVEILSPYLQSNRIDLPLRIQCAADQSRSVHMLTGGHLEETNGADRPALIVSRCRGPIWDIAKAYQSTVTAICQANGLDGSDLTGETMLLIPLGQSLRNKEDEYGNL